MGIVHRALDLDSRERVAVKVLTVRDPQARERFSREAELLSQLNHPGIVRYVAKGQLDNGDEYIAMEWLEGQTLSARMKAGDLSVPESLHIAQQTAAALGAAHAHRIIHRDIKPGNIFLVGEDSDQIKLLDFGIARRSQDNLELTLPGARIGTIAYMSPEQAWGDKDLDARSDVFSLGVVLFRCLTGQRPFDGEHTTAVLAKILLEEAPRVRELAPEVPSAVDELVARMLSKEPRDRPENGDALANAISELIEMTPPPDTITSHSSSITASERRFVSLLMIDAALDPDRTVADRGSHPAEHVERELRSQIEQRGGRFDLLANGSVVATFSTVASAKDQAALAAQCSLALQPIVPARAMAIASGLSVMGRRAPVGDVIDRAVANLRAAAGSTIRVDELTAGLAGERFELIPDAHGITLRGARAVARPTRRLLGRQTPCVGRGRELGTLEAIFSECADESVARAALVVGEAGLGKSRVRHELLSRLRSNGEEATVIIGRGDELSAGSAFGMVARALRELVGMTDGEDPVAKHARLRALLARCLPPQALGSVAEFLGEMAGANAPQSSERFAAATQDRALMAEGIRQAFIAWIAAECLLQPVILVFDDLQWCDPSTIALIDATLRQLQDSPLLVLGFARPEVHDVFPKLWHARALQQISLSRLTKRSSAKLIREVLGNEVEPTLVDRLVELADGNAFYLEELIRAVSEGQSDELPPTVLAMVQARLGALDPDGRRVLRAASVFGGRFWESAVIALLGGEDRQPLTQAWLSRLEAEEHLTRRATSRFPDEVEFSFRHALLREGAYATLTEQDRTLAHRLAGNWLAERGERDPRLLAEHFDRGGDAEEAAGWWGRAAEAALKGGDFQSAIELGERAVGSGLSGPALGACRLAQAEAHRWLGSSANAALCAEYATQELAPGSAIWFQAATELVVGRNGELDQRGMRTAVSYACRLEPAEDARGAQAICLARAGILLEDTSDRTDLLWSTLNQLTQKVPKSDLVAHAWLHAVSAMRATLDARPGQAIEQQRGSMDLFARAGDRRNACVRMMALGNMLAQVGDWNAAQLALESSVSEAQQLGLRKAETWARQALAPVLVASGETQRGLAEAERALEASKRLSSPWLLSECYVRLATVMHQCGEHEQAAKYAREGAKQAGDAGWMHARALATEAAALVALDAIAEAKLVADEAWERFKAAGIPDEGELLVCAYVTRAYEAAGEMESARRIASAATARLERMAESMANEDARAKLMAVDVHAYLSQVASLSQVAT